MLIIMSQKAPDRHIEGVKNHLIDQGIDFHQSTGANRVILGIIGATDRMDIEAIKALPSVLEVFKIPEESA